MLASKHPAAPSWPDHHEFALDGNGDGNVRSQHQAGAATDSQILLRNWAELDNRYT
jgi:hypothetical protein